MKILFAGLIILILSGCSVMNSKDGYVKPRDWVYGSAATLIVMDSYSTSVALKENENAYETGLALRAIGGKRPSDAHIVGFTALSLGILEWSRYWKPFYRGFYQWSILYSRPGVIAANFKVAFDQ